MSYPRLLIDLEKIKYNAKTVQEWCKGVGIKPFFVGKCVCEDDKIVESVIKCGYTAIADSREENLQRIKVDANKVLLRIGMPDRADEIVKVCDISLQSEPKTIAALAKAAQKSGKKHKIILMIDLGDLREGIFYKDFEEIIKTAKLIKNSEGLILYGIGTNLTCYGSVMPDENNLGWLAGIAKRLREDLNEEIPVISGGNSSSLYLIKNGKMPKEINNLRIGEAILLGTDTASGNKFCELKDDAFVLEAEVVEIRDKPSYPIGVRSVDAFGNKVEYVDRGYMRRGILAIGKQDVFPNDLIPLDPSLEIIGASSDHTIINLSGTDTQVGDIIRFKLNYEGLLKCCTSMYVGKSYINE